MQEGDSQSVPPKVLLNIGSTDVFSELCQCCYLLLFLHLQVLADHLQITPQRANCLQVSCSAYTSHTSDPLKMDSIFERCPIRAWMSDAFRSNTPPQERLSNQRGPYNAAILHLSIAYHDCLACSFKCFCSKQCTLNSWSIGFPEVDP